MKSVFILNAGSSSVKASLLLLAEDEEEDPKTNNDVPTKPPIRLVTALAERLNTSDSVMHLTISVSAAKAAFQDHPHDSHKKKFLLRSNSLQLTSRSTAEHHEDDDESKTESEPEKKNVKMEEAFLTHKRSVELILQEMNAYDSRLLSSVIAVGHRVVHGGPTFCSSVVITDNVLTAIQNVSHLAPLHNPANLVGIQIAQQVFPSHIPNVAVFDTAFHSTMPSYAYTYPIPKEYRDDYAIRKYGFHGTSVQYVSKRGEAMVRSHLANPSTSTTATPKIKLIVAHLGNGASVTAVVDGKSMDTTMEFTPLSGIMMGTRSGSIDPTIIPFASKFMNKTPDEVLNDLNKKSGLLGMCGNNDMRTVLTLASQGDDQAALAAEMFVYILAKHIASLLVACGGTIDALIFTAGIGENSAYIRRETVSRLSPLLGHVILDEDHNNTNGKKSGGIISQAPLDTDPVAKPLILVIPTDEEAMICLECERLVHNHDI